MILSIRTIKDVGIFKDFKWDRINNNLREFKKVNLIYGWNASGKTTLSRIFACLEKGHPGKLKLSENSECILEFWDHNQKSYVSIGSKNIPESLSNKVRVFNEDFVEENIEWTSGKLGKILMIGQQSIQLKADLKSLEEKIEKQKEIVDKIEKQIKNVENEMSDLLSKAAKEVRDEFRKVKNIRPLSGRAKDYINYNSQDAEKILAEFSKTKDKYNNEDLIRKWKLTLEEKHPKAEIKPLQIEELLKPIRELIQKTKNILETEIPETTIEISLNSKKLDKSVREWLLRGYQLHKNLNEPKVCLFCKNEISNKRWQQIENSFAKEVEDFYHKLDNIERQISKFIPPTLNLQKDEFYLEHHTEYLNLHQRLSDATNTLSKLINSLSDKIEAKRENPSTKISVDSKLFEQTLNEIEEILNQVNILIEKNNNTTKEFFKELQNAAHSLEKYFVLKHAETYNKINKQLLELQQSMEQETEKMENLENEKNTIIQQINNYKIAAEEFNKKLKLLLGYNELSLEPFEEGYKILRNGEIAQNLSEGERNIISLIYFLIKLKENTFDAKNGIVVIDDPVSSLDSQNSYGVYALIKEAFQELKPKQLFIFTHNYQFFKLIRDWFKHSRRDASIYFLRSKFRNQNRVSEFEMADKLLLEHNSEYTFLFKLIYSKANTPSSSLEEDYILPNVLRKFLESYISFKVPLSGVNIHEKLRKLSEDYPNLDKTLIHRLESFTQDQSHPLYHDSIYDFDERLLGEIQLACRNILQLLQATDPNHLKHLLSEIGESTERLEI